MALGLLVLTTQSCSKNHDSTPATMTLYDTLGGTTMVNDPAHSGTNIEKGRLGLRTVVDSAIFIIAADSKINGYFTVLLKEVGMGNLSGFQALSKNLTDFLCVATGAKNFSYGGKNMKDAHNPTGNSRMTGTVNSADFDQFVVDVAASAKKNGLSDPIIARVGALLNTLKTTVVQR
ncbi:MAG: group 1 truncated hemoglobin [Bacteroidetes bacterium]|nr:group 1 truncated hemoglobin [Bacteroidota bacterium]